MSRWLAHDGVKRGLTYFVNGRLVKTKPDVSTSLRHARRLSADGGDYACSLACNCVANARIHDHQAADQNQTIPRECNTLHGKLPKVEEKENAEKRDVETQA